MFNYTDQYEEIPQTHTDYLGPTGIEGEDVPERTVECKNCAGTGLLLADGKYGVYAPGSDCPTCHGTGVVPASQEAEKDDEVLNEYGQCAAKDCDRLHDNQARHLPAPPATEVGEKASTEKLICPVCSKEFRKLNGKNMHMIGRHLWKWTNDGTGRLTPAPTAPQEPAGSDIKPIKPIPGQMIKNAWELYPHPMDAPEYIMMLTINALVAAHNRRAEYQRGRADQKREEQQDGNH